MERLMAALLVGVLASVATACSVDRGGLAGPTPDASATEGGGTDGHGSADAGSADAGSADAASADAPTPCEHCPDACTPGPDGGAESCDGTDEDCDGQVDEAVVGAPVWYADADGDGHGDRSAPRRACDPPPGHVASGDDCDDADESVGPDGDTDGDGIPDCLDEDDDGDGLSDADERAGAGGFLTDPLLADTDGDGVDDGSDPAPVTAACTRELLFHDPFRGDPGNRWTAESGAWSWDGADLYASTDDTAGATTWIGERTWNDYILEVRLRLDSNAGDGGVGFRAEAVSPDNDGGAHYYVGLYPGGDSVGLGYMDGSWNPLETASATVEAGQWHVLQIRLAGTAIEAWVDAQQVLTADHTLYGAGSVTLRTFQSPTSYDYVIVCR